MVQNSKSPEEWKRIIAKLSDKKFEELCYYLVKSMPGFVNVHLRDGGADGHRDIDAELKINAPDGLTELTEKWRFECKKLSKGVAFDDVSGKITAADLNKIDKFIIMSNMHLTPPCQDEIDKIKDNINIKILDWTGLHFQDILFQHPNTFSDFFS
ncbi:MAG: restriction endonuclease, partial [Candidatus Woesearchaeota archaeon]